MAESAEPEAMMALSPDYEALPCVFPFQTLNSSLDYWDTLPYLGHASPVNHTYDTFHLYNASHSAQPPNCSHHQHHYHIDHGGGQPQVTKDMVFNDISLMTVIAYSVLFCIAAIGNLTVFITLFRNRHRKSRVNLFIMHLAVADLIVTFIMMPLEIGWHLTVSWIAGDAACRIFMFFRAFGFYLSSFVLVTISLDRYFAVKHPLSLNDAGKRGKLMLILAWMFSTVASIPQVKLKIMFIVSIQLFVQPWQTLR